MEKDKTHPSPEAQIIMLIYKDQLLKVIYTSGDYTVCVASNIVYLL